LSDGQIWEVQVKSKSDLGLESAWIDIQKATAKPKTAPAPSSIQAKPSGSDGIQVSWSAVTCYDVDRYEIILWDSDSYATRDTNYLVKSLVKGHRCNILVATWVRLLGGPAAGPAKGAGEVTVGSA
jgi:hypothetical protein